MGQCACQGWMVVWTHLAVLLPQCRQVGCVLIAPIAATAASDAPTHNLALAEHRMVPLAPPLPSLQRELLRAKRTLITRHDSDLKVRLLPLPGSFRQGVTSPPAAAPGGAGWCCASERCTQQSCLLFVNQLN